MVQLWRLGKLGKLHQAMPLRNEHRALPIPLPNKYGMGAFENRNHLPDPRRQIRSRSITHDAPRHRPNHPDCSIPVPISALVQRHRLHFLRMRPRHLSHTTKNRIGDRREIINPPASMEPSLYPFTRKHPLHGWKTRLFAHDTPLISEIDTSEATAVSACATAWPPWKIDKDNKLLSPPWTGKTHHTPLQPGQNLSDLTSNPDDLRTLLTRLTQ